MDSKYDTMAMSNLTFLELWFVVNSLYQKKGIIALFIVERALALGNTTV